jgi:restriction endonuclease S subunit
MIKVDNNNLPENWVLTTIGEIGIVVSGGTPSTRQPEFWGGDIAWITPADLSNYKDKYIQHGQRNLTKIGLENSSAKLLPKGSILFSSRAPIGYTVVAKNELATNQGFKNLILTNSGYSDYIYYYLKNSKQLAESFASGTTFMELSATKFSQIPFPLPPLAEQHRIVEKIEELFSELDKAQESFLNAQKQLEIYRQVVLKDAFDGYPLILLKELTELITKGASPKWQGINYTDDESQILFITSTNVLSNYLKLSKQFVEKEFNKKQKRSILKKGDVLLNIVGASIGRAAYYNYDFEANINQAVCLIRPKENINYKYLTYYLNSPNAIKYYKIREVNVARANISLKDVSEIQIPITSIELQEQIVQEIEYRFTLIENLENSIIDNLKRIEIFRQTILQKAFSGNLVPQYANDGLASKLLQRIKKEIKVYQIQQKEIAKSIPQKLVFMEPNKTIKEILEEATEPMEAKEIWQKSLHRDDIEKFYEELKQISESIEEIREGVTSKLSLKR